MDPNVLAFLLSGCFTMIAYILITAIMKSRKRPPNSDDAPPQGPVTVSV